MATTSRHVRATLCYYQPKADGTPPEVDDIFIVLGSKDMDKREVLINDIRGEEDLYQLEQHGFQFLKYASNLDDFADESTVKSAYYAEVEELLLKSLGASKVIIFNHIIRSGPSYLVDQTAYLTGISGPAPRVHIDQTPKGALQLANRVLPPDVATEVTSRRWQIINVWRPLKTVQKDPLAVTDSTTVPDSDLVTIKRIYPGNKEGENCTVTAGSVSQHRWYYLNQQQPDEVLIFKQHDSDPNSKTRGTPHSSFPYPGAEHLENRESIEVRAIVCY